MKKVGRPSKSELEKKKGIFVKLPPWLINWMDAQPDTNRAVLIEEAIKTHFKVDENTRYEHQLDLCIEVAKTYDKRYKKNRD
ncbi:hypothetical protein [Algibacillus agarilyticus]|uniref:hypothetical protein n=1 Tax=Algibacillus agarilyticus TaxID=2234133 RepID=UPI000DD06CFE|nr:hypothetical protein [Algibacillus agarilyticus]